MYNYNSLIEKLKINNNPENRKKLKAIINALIKNGEALIIKQSIDTDYQKVAYLYYILNELKTFFDYGYNSKEDLTRFLYYILNPNSINLNAIFCPGYTKNGYKNYIGNNNTVRIEILKELSEKLKELQIQVNIKVILANIFLENTDYITNPNWEQELLFHEQKFIELAKKHFDDKEILKLSSIYQSKKYIEGFILEDICHGKTYDNFYKNNLEFYRKMGWNEEQIKYRNDRLFTIYNLMSEYINSQQNGIYIPMETMYSRSKVMTNNNVCTMYLLKK